MLVFRKDGSIWYTPEDQAKSMRPVIGALACGIAPDEVKPTPLPRDDILCLLEHLDDRVEFASDLTVADLFRCLAPWGPVISSLAGIDWKAWHKVVTPAQLRVIATSNQTAHTPSSRDLQAVEILSFISLCHRPADILVVPEWQAQGINREGRTINLDLIPETDWAKVPIRISTRTWFVEDQAVRIREPIGFKDQSVPFVMLPTFMDCVVRGLFARLAADPDDARDFRAPHRDGRQKV